MSDYSKTYDGAAKDSAQSTILGSDFDTEFSAISTAIATKTNKAVPAAAGNVPTLTSSGDLQDSGVTSTELAILDGATVTTAELNVLDGITATTTELNYTDGVTSNIQTQLDSKIDILAFRGALVHKNGSDQTVSGTTNSILFAGEEYDTDSIHSTSTNTDRLTVPSGITRVKLSASLVINSTIADGKFSLALFKNGSAVFTGYVFDQVHPALTSQYRLNIVSPVVNVTSGDYFTLNVGENSTGTVTVEGLSYESWFAMEIIE